MPAPNALADIATALTAFAPATLRASSLTLLAALGYRSDRTLPIPGAPDPAAFRRMAEVASGKTLHAEKAKFAEWNQADLLFQLTDTEVRDDQTLFQDAALEPGLLESYLFFAIELRGAQYSRTALADVTRQINRLFPMPVVVLFSYADRLSLAVVHRRQHRRDPSRDVLGRVSLIRDIETRNPHRAHLDILHALSLPERLHWLDAHKQPRSFDGLLAALLAALDTEALNKRFYTALFAWFTRAVAEATFPTKQARTLAPEEHVIRLITRLLFVWFVKEKGLIAAELFTEAQVAGLLKDYARDTGDSYYRAVVQNLFFATLNTEIAKRGFSREKRATHRDFSRYRYRSEMQDPTALLALFRRTPFINGGLFDCLDSETATKGGGWRIDCFTDTVTDPKRREYGLLSIPNRLFFDADGLITLFDKFTFTVEENTPAEQDVALDPELLGKVFENLLAAVTPETRETARKQTGSYYTPRAVVDYMVDEALVAALADRVKPADGDAAFWQARLHYLLDYADAFDDAEQLFTETERDGVVQAIADTTVLDPAVGSGAFPMGVLHKLTLALRRLDPDNRRWEALQREKTERRATAAFQTDDRVARNEELAEISDTFERYRDSDFGRKLYLIQNSIFGVDIQPVASQIAKLRFFISLAIEQAPTEDEAANYGIKPLPNLETRFVAANTLLGLDKPAQQTLGRTATVARLERALHENRERHFHATTRDTKTTYRDKDVELRTELAEALCTAGFPAADANKIAQWDPYDQNASADWFDAEYMFGAVDGFDIVIGNPPYAKVEHLDNTLRNQIKKNFGWMGDLYEHFIFKGIELVVENGVFSYIANDSYVTFSTKRRIRDLMREYQLNRLVKAPAQTFEASIYTAIFVLSKKRPGVFHGYTSGAMIAPQFHYEEYGQVSYSAVDKIPGKKFLLSGNNDILIRLLEFKNIGEFCHILDTGIHSGNVRSKIFFAEYARGRERLLQGKQIHRFSIQWNAPRAKYKFCDIHYEPLPVPGIGRGGKASTRNEYWHFCGDIQNHHQPERLLIRQTDDDLVVAYHSEEQFGRFYTDNTLFTVLPNASNVSLKYLLALFNSKLLNFIYHAISQEQGKSQAQVKIKNVNVLPAIIPEENNDKVVVELVDSILKAKGADPAADTSAEEAEIDRLVYALYGLTEAEVAAVEGR